VPIGGRALSYSRTSSALLSGGHLLGLFWSSAASIDIPWAPYAPALCTARGASRPLPFSLLGFDLDFRALFGQAVGFFDDFCGKFSSARFEFELWREEGVRSGFNRFAWGKRRSKGLFTCGECQRAVNWFEWSVPGELFIMRVYLGATCCLPNHQNSFLSVCAVRALARFFTRVAQPEN
jgi:hypothetical protein